MNAWLLAFLVISASYLIGAIPFGYLVGRWKGINIFEHGSRNIGATNIGRVLGRKYGILVFVLDFAKGALPAAAGLSLRRVASSDWQDSFLVLGLGVWAGMAAFLGHLFSIYLRFKGGKGVATGAGVVVVLAPLPALGALVTWVAVLCGSRYVSLASLTAAVALCAFQLVLSRHPFEGSDLITTLFAFVAAGLVILRHRANIARLAHGDENRLRESFAMLQLTKTIHVLALGLWFGSSAFFTLVTAPTLFSTFQGIAVGEQRPKWLPLPEEFKERDRLIDGPREQGTRVAGAAVAPLFLWFFLLQGTCGFLAIASALHWPRSIPEKVHPRRIMVLLLALATVLIGFPLERTVSELRVNRDRAIDNYLKEAQDRYVAAEHMRWAKGEFTAWHLASLGLALVTLVLVTWATAMAARLPAALPAPPSANGAPAQENASGIPHEPLQGRGPS